MPRARIGLATPAFSGPRSTNELPRHGNDLRFYGKAATLKRENGVFRHKPGRKLGLNAAGKRNARLYFMDSSNSLIQSFFFRTSRAFAPSGGPTIPSFSIKSIKRAARP